MVHLWVHRGAGCATCHSSAREHVRQELEGGRERGSGSMHWDRNGLGGGQRSKKLEGGCSCGGICGDWMFQGPEPGPGSFSRGAVCMMREKGSGPLL